MLNSGGSRGGSHRCGDIFKADGVSHFLPHITSKLLSNPSCYRHGCHPSRLCASNLSFCETRLAFRLDVSFIAMRVILGGRPSQKYSQNGMHIDLAVFCATIFDDQGELAWEARPSAAKQISNEQYVACKVKKARSICEDSTLSPPCF